MRNHDWIFMSAETCRYTLSFWDWPTHDGSHPAPDMNHTYSYMTSTWYMQKHANICSALGTGQHIKILNQLSISARRCMCIAGVLIRSNACSHTLSSKCTHAETSLALSTRKHMQIHTWLLIRAGICTHALQSLLKSVFIDTAYMNVMQLESESEGPDYMLCDSIEDYVKYEQHRLCIINRVQEEDLSVENRYYRDVTMLYRMNIVN
jgi:hypothetical protein